MNTVSEPTESASQPRLTPDEQLVLATFFKLHHGNEEKHFALSYRSLALESGLSVKHTYVVAQQLVAKGLIDLVYPGDSSEGKAAEWVLPVSETLTHLRHVDVPLLTLLVSTSTSWTNNVSSTSGRRCVRVSVSPKPLVWNETRDLRTHPLGMVVTYLMFSGDYANPRGNKVTVKELAQVFQVTERTVRNWKRELEPILLPARGSFTLWTADPELLAELLDIEPDAQQQRMAAMAKEKAEYRSALDGDPIIDGRPISEMFAGLGSHLTKAAEKPAVEATVEEPAEGLVQWGTQMIPASQAEALLAFSARMAVA